MTLEKWIPPDTDITAAQISDGGLQKLTDAGCSGAQYCQNHNADENTCANGGYSMTACSGRIRYFIKGCCKPNKFTNYYALNVNYVWCCDKRLEIQPTSGKFHDDL